MFMPTRPWDIIVRTRDTRGLGDQIGVLIGVICALCTSITCASSQGCASAGMSRLLEGQWQKGFGGVEATWCGKRGDGRL